LPKVAWHADEPFAISSAFALYFISKLARQHVKVVLSGDGGDEVFGGYLWRHINFPELARIATSCFARMANALAPTSPLGRLLPPRLVLKLRRVFARDERYLDSFINFRDQDLAELLVPDLAEFMIGHWADNMVQHHLKAAPTKEQLTRKLYCDIKSTLV